MTRTENIAYLRQKEKEGNEEAIIFMDLICLYLPRIIEYPKAATLAEVERYNSLVRSNISDKEMLDNLIMRR